MKQGVIDFVDLNLRSFLIEKGYSMTMHYQEIPNPDFSHLTYVEYSKGARSILIKQQDWRDEYYLFDIFMNFYKAKQVDVTKYNSYEKAAEVIFEIVRSRVGRTIPVFSDLSLSSIIYRWIKEFK